MGYSSTAEGEIDIYPPLTHQELKNLPDLSQPYGEEIELVITEVVLAEDYGDLVSRAAFKVVPVSGQEEWKRYYTADQLKTLVAAFPDHTFTGYFEFLGEDGERWRTVIRDGEVIDNVQPELRWPE